MNDPLDRNHFEAPAPPAALRSRVLLAAGAAARARANEGLVEPGLVARWVDWVWHSRSLRRTWLASTALLLLLNVVLSSLAPPTAVTEGTGVAPISATKGEQR